MSTKRDF